MRLRSWDSHYRAQPGGETSGTVFSQTENFVELEQLDLSDNVGSPDLPLNLWVELRVSPPLVFKGYTRSNRHPFEKLRHRRTPIPTPTTLPVWERWQYRRCVARDGCPKKSFGHGTAFLTAPDLAEEDL
jgi:hypothetical protein